MIHGEKAHSRYFSEDAFKKLTGDNKELMISPALRMSTSTTASTSFRLTKSNRSSVNTKIIYNHDTSRVSATYSRTQPLRGAEIGQFMNEMSDEARRITCQMNNAYHTPDEIRELLAQLTGQPVPDTVRYSLRSMPTSARTYIWVRMSLSTTVATSRTMVASHSATVAKSGTAWYLPLSTTALPPRTDRLPTRPLSYWDATCG